MKRKISSDDKQPSIQDENSKFNSPALEERFSKIKLSSGFKRKLSFQNLSLKPKNIMNEFELTPILEEFSNLQLASNVKKVKDDFDVKRRSLDVKDDLIEVHQTNEDAKSKPFKESENSEIDQPTTNLQLLKDAYISQIGNEGLQAMKASKKKSEIKNEAYSLSLITAISQDQVIANQFIEGGVDTSVFENFIFEIL